MLISGGSSEAKRSDTEGGLFGEDPWKSMEKNILDDKDRAYLVELLSNLGDTSKPKDLMGTRRDDIPGGKNSMYSLFLDILHDESITFNLSRSQSIQ